MEVLNEDCLPSFVTENVFRDKRFDLESSWGIENRIDELLQTFPA